MKRILFSLLAAFFLLVFGYAYSEDTPGIELDPERLEAGLPQNLNGLWWFKFGEYIPLEEVSDHLNSQEMMIVDIPQVWNDLVEDISDDPFQHGIATYAIPLRLSRPLTRPVSINPLYVDSGYQVYWIPEAPGASPILVGQSGDWVNGQYGGLESNYFNFPIESNGLLVFYVAKSNVYKGGIRKPVKIQLTQALNNSFNKEWIVRSLLIGGLLVMLIHYTVQYLFAREQTSAMAISIVCAVAVIRSVVASGMMNLFAYDYFEEINQYGLWLRFEYATLIWAPTSFLIFFHTIIDGLIPKWLRQVALFLAFVVSVYIFLLPLDVVAKSLPFYQIYIIFWVCVTMTLNVKGAIQRYPFALRILLNSTVVALGVVHDVYAASSATYNFYIVEYTLLLFLFLLSQLVAKRLREGLEQSIRLAEEKAILQDAHQRAIEASELDHLTGLYNRLALSTRLNDLVSITEKKIDCAGVILFDLDHFKSINDTHGHDVGDAVIKTVAAILKDHSLRADDIRCRYGGEEFLVILPGATLQRTQAVAEELRAKIANGGAIEHGDVSLRVTASFGVSMASCESQEHIMSAIKHADLALYKAKGRGRNCVETQVGS